MAEIGTKYKETKSMLVGKINDPDNIDLLIIEREAHNHRCYFCQHKIPEGDKMFEMTHYQNIGGKNVDSTYYVDEICAGLARNKNKKSVEP